jgi:hypothetical protein
MRASHEHDKIIHYAVEEPIRKPVNQRTMRFAVQGGVSLRCAENGIDGGVHLGQKLLPEPLALALLPRIRARDVARCRRSYEVTLHPRRARA